MDGDCAICSRGARMIHRLDRSGAIRIATIQTPLGEALMAREGIDAADPETWLFFDGGRVWRDAEAIIHVGLRSGGWGRAFGLLRIVPRRLRDWLYRRLARNRYAWFGRGEMCAIPDPAFRARLIGQG
jgi:predicted DCC family thiol-disulfide oxidoreductase YuxK